MGLDGSHNDSDNYDDDDYDDGDDDDDLAKDRYCTTAMMNATRTVMEI